METTFKLLKYNQVKSKEKAEIQALSSFGFQYVTEVYLPRK
jgi:meiotic recombination protein SPO11